MKRIKPILFIFLLFIVYIYVAYITLFPNSIVLFEGEKVSINNERTMQTATNLTESRVNQLGSTNLTLNLFNTIPLKQVEVNVIKKTKVIPLGNAIGLKLYTNGVMVVGMSEVQGEDKKNYKPYENRDIKEGDMIVEVDNTSVTCISELINTVNKSKGEEMKVKYVRDYNTKTMNITPVKTGENEYKLGLWVRDAQRSVLEQHVFMIQKVICIVH